MRARGIGWYGLGLVLGVSCVLNPGPDLPGSAPAGGPDLGSGARNNTGGTGAGAGAGGSTGGTGGTTPIPPGSGGTLPIGEPDAGMGADGGEGVDGAAGEGGEAGTAG